MPQQHCNHHQQQPQQKVSSIMALTISIQDILAGIFLLPLSINVQNRLSLGVIEQAQNKKEMDCVHRQIRTGRIYLLEVPNLDYSSWIEIDNDDGYPVQYCRVWNHFERPGRSPCGRYRELSNVRKRLTYLYYLSYFKGGKQAYFPGGNAGSIHHYKFSGNIQHHYDFRRFVYFAKRAHSLALSLHEAGRRINPVPEVGLGPEELIPNKQKPNLVPQWLN